VVDYFEASWSRDPELVPMILEAARRYGAAESIHGLACCDHLALTRGSLGSVLAALSQAEDERVAFHLNRVIAGAPADLLAGNESQILETPRLSEETAARLHRRRELSGWPAEKLWEETQELARRAPGRYVDEMDLGAAEDLIDALAPRDEPGAARILAAIGSGEGWLEIFAIDLAAARGLREAVPALVEKLRIDADYLRDRSMRALARIGDSRAADLIRAAYPGGGWDFRLYASEVLSAVKSEASEEALLALLCSERDLNLRTWLCLGLCEQFSERGLEVVLRQIKSGYDRSVASLEEMVLPAAELLGVPLRQARAWRAEAELARTRRAARERELAALAADWEEREEGEDDLALPDDREDDLEALPGPIGRAEPKVGRNAPCPCGSGRKFKKCCGA
jgi:hypothetical protein